MSWFSRAVKTVTSPVRAAGRAIDPESSKSIVGKTLGSTGRSIIRQGAATALVGVTGGAALVSARVRTPALQGYRTGAVVGGAILAAGRGTAPGSSSSTAPASATAPVQQAETRPDSSGPAPVATPPTTTTATPPLTFRAWLRALITGHA